MEIDSSNAETFDCALCGQEAIHEEQVRWVRDDVCDRCDRRNVRRLRQTMDRPVTKWVARTNDWYIAHQGGVTSDEYGILSESTLRAHREREIEFDEGHGYAYNSGRTTCGVEDDSHDVTRSSERPTVSREGRKLDRQRPLSKNEIRLVHALRRGQYEDTPIDGLPRCPDRPMNQEQVARFMFLAVTRVSEIDHGPGGVFERRVTDNVRPAIQMRLRSMSLAKIGGELGLTRQRVHQILKANEDMPLWDALCLEPTGETLRGDDLIGAGLLRALGYRMTEAA